jgi:hypothetical protein
VHLHGNARPPAVFDGFRVLAIADALKFLLSSFRRKPESSAFWLFAGSHWIPAFAGMTIKNNYTGSVD